jgi:hypothetical protein
MIRVSRSVPQFWEQQEPEKVVAIDLKLEMSSELVPKT